MGLAWTELDALPSGGRRMEAVVVNGEVILNDGVHLPMIKAVGAAAFEPIHQLRELGVVSCGCVWVWNGILFFGDLVELQTDYLAEWFNTATDPYTETPPEAWTERVAFRWISSADARRWKRIVTGSIDGATAVLDYPVRFAVGEVVSFIETGATPETVADGTTLVDRATITAISEDGKTLTLDTEALTAATGYLYPDGYFEERMHVDDTTGNGRIVRIAHLGNRLVVLMDNAFIIVQETGDATDLFLSDRPIEAEGEAIWFPWSLVSIDDEKLLYRTQNQWMTFDLTGRRPVLQAKLALVEPYFKGLTADDALAVADNTRDKLIWIFLPDRTVLYDYAFDRVRTVDQVLQAGGTVRHPDLGKGAAVDKLFLLARTEGSGSRVLNYGQARSDGSWLYTREGAAYVAEVVFGLSGDSARGTAWESYRVELANDSPLEDFTVKLETLRLPNDASPRTLVEKTVSAEAPLVKVHWKAAWWRETLRFSAPIRIASREVALRTYTNTRRGA